MTRQTQFENWLQANFPDTPLRLHPLPGDASFRRYFLIEDQPEWLAVDAPPSSEKTFEFVQIAQAYRDLGLNVPRILAYHTELGFLIVSCLGESRYLEVLQNNPSMASPYYSAALESLVKITQASPTQAAFGHFDGNMMQQELENHTLWFLERYLKISLTPSMHALLNETYAKLIARASAQKQVCIHRDYHSRNLIVCDNHTPGILDFQDAMLGPITYDAVSLLRDAYIDWPADTVHALAQGFYQNLKETHPDYSIDFATFWDDFNWMGMQRHLKAIFIFARKYLRDQNSGYLNDIPRTFRYLQSVGEQYPELSTWLSFLKNEVEPRLYEAL